ncbi:chitin synthase chs-2-like [Babylonia areolata]|uniref:chitin synthase chs-2-like n=1 Tax=Babylonia areolata TaxID=304850 RepID=UPI003FD44270
MDGFSAEDSGSRYSEEEYCEDERYWEDDSYYVQGEIPRTSDNGPLLERPITVTLPESGSSSHSINGQAGMEEDKDLLPHDNHSLPNGFVNAGFEPGPVGPEGGAGSDSSGTDNYKAGEREDGGEQSDGELFKRRTFPGRTSFDDSARNSCASITSMESLEGRSRWRGWDVFRTYKRQKDEGLDDHTISKFRKMTKVVVGIFLTLSILVTTVISKSTLLLIASSIYQNATLYCVELPGGRQFSSCSRVYPETLTGTVYKLSQNVQVRWMWALFLLIVGPYVMTFVKCTWRACFKTTRTPTVSAFCTVMISETLNSVGVCLFAFQVLPSLDSVRGLVLTVGVAFLPSVLKLFDRENPGGRHCFTYFVDVLALLVQASALLLWPVRDILYGEVTSQTWSIPVSLFLVSCGYWENYINKHTALGSLGRKLRELKKNTRRMRVKIYIGVSLWKIVLTLALMMTIISDLRLECLEVLYFSGDNGAGGCPHFNDPYGVANVEALEYFNDAFWVMLVQLAACLLCYSFAKTACKVLLQVGSFAMPLTIATPILLGAFISECETWDGSSSISSTISNSSTVIGAAAAAAATTSNPLGLPSYLFWTCEVGGSAHSYLSTLLTTYYLPAAVLWWLSFVWVTAHIWFPSVERLVQTERLFVQPLYCGVFLEQSLILNRRRDDKDREAKTEKKTALQFFQAEHDQEQEAGFKPRGSLRTDVTPMIYVCATMWHETEKEMNQVLKSLFRLDLDQCTRKHAYVFFDVVDPDYYEFEAHFFIDDAFEPHDDEDFEYRANDFVKQFVRVIDRAASAVHRTQIHLGPPTKYPTPYGGRLEWTLPGLNKLTIHLKDKTKVRHKKRWSQVMYMYYLLGHRLVAQKMPDARRKQIQADNTFLLTLDGDMDFQPSAVQLLVDRMKKNEKVGAACGRIHPVGTGPMVWYQKFEYAVSHWLQKATEHMIGCVLCSPGCFSLFRASSLMDDNVMRKYATLSTQARHYVQYDQGEDRWLCTLLLQQGYRVEYCAAADALTYAPEGFEEFFNQRRRWSPSTMANIMDLLQSWRMMIKINENMSVLYMAYQLLLFMSSMLTPGTIFLLIVGALNTAFQQIDLMQALFINLVPVILFLVVCLTARSKIQLALAGVMSIGYALLMMVVIVGLILEMKKDGICAPTTIFMIFVVGVFVVSAIMHPMEFYCLFHGLLYLLAIPAMSMLLMIYSICNLNVVSWGTRETLTPAPPSEGQGRKKNVGKPTRFQQLLNLFMVGRSEGSHTEEEDSDYGFSCGNLFRCLCCPRPVEDKTSLKMAAILEKLDQLERSMAGNKRDGGAGSLSGGSRLPSLTEEAETAEMQSESIKQLSPMEPKLSGTGEGDSVKLNPLFQELGRANNNSNYEGEFSPPWMMDGELGAGKVRYLGTEESKFWRELIARYLYPLQNDPARQQKLEEDLKQLRNKMSLMFFLLNALFIVIVAALQYTNAANDGNGLAIPLQCVNDEGKNLTLEPISLLFMAIFGVALAIQFLAMFFHRMGTFLHIVASTEVNCMKLNQQEMAAMAVSDKLELVRQMQNFGDDDDDARSDITSTSMETSNGDSSSTADESPRMGRRRNVMRLTKKRGRPAEQKGSNLASRLMERYLKLAKDLRQERVSDHSSGKGGRRNSSRKKRKTQRAIEAIEKSSEKSNVLLKAHKWQSMQSRVAGRSSQGGSQQSSTDTLQKDPWLSMVRGVLSQSRSSLNTISEEDARNTLNLKRKFTWASSADTTSALMRRSDLSLPRDSRPTSRGSFAGHRSSLDILSEVKEVATPQTSPTGLYERIEMQDVLRVGEEKAAERDSSKGPEDSEPNSETASFREEDVVSIPPSTATTVLSDREDGHVFSYQVTSTPTTQAEVHATTAGDPQDSRAQDSFSRDSPGQLIRASVSQGGKGSEGKSQESSETTSF